MNKSEKEHVTKFFYKNFKNFKIKNFKYKSQKYKFNLAVDEKKDLKQIVPLIKKNSFYENFSWHNWHGNWSKTFRGYR